MKTAIEWLNAELTEYLHIQLIWSNDKDPRNISVDPARLNGMFEKAKEMEQQQIMDAWDDGFNKVAKLIKDATQRNLNL
jgi:hypothetical protein